MFDEHRTLSSFVEQEIVSTSRLRAWAATAWAGAAIALAWTDASAITSALVTIPLLGVFWLIDFFYSYYGVVYKMRRLQIREYIDRLPDSDASEFDTWKTPENPFTALTGAEKKKAVRDTIVSPAVQGAYALLGGATLLFLFTRG